MQVINKLMTEKVIKFELEKHNKNSIRYKEIAEDGMPPVLGSIYTHDTSKCLFQDY